jgi:cellulose synthase/poly-beta-1,6-N-acetylglucosamine synthase-like glycosyltransferase
MNTVVQVLLWMAAVVSLYFAVFWFLVLIDGSSEPRRKEMKKWPSVTVIIPAYNEEDCIIPTMESVLALDYPRELLQLIVVNDGSKDRTDEKVKQAIAAHPESEILYISKPNGGKGTALNVGIKQARGEYLATMDSDSFVEPAALMKMLPRFVEDDIAAVVPAMKVRDPKNWLQRIQWYEYVVNMFYKEMMGRLDCLHVIPGPFPIYRTDVVRELGGFAENHNLTEDLEFTLRLQSRNYRIIQVMDTEVTTLAPDDTKSFYAQRNRWFKGAVMNAYSYRWMLFNRKFGDFAMIQLPTILISGVLSLILVSSFIYYSLKPYVKFGYNLFYVDYDIWTIIKALTWHPSFWDLDFMSVVLMFIMTAISLTMIYLAHRRANESMIAKGIGPFAVFLVVYYLMLGFAWVGVARDLVFKKVQKW